MITIIWKNNYGNTYNSNNLVLLIINYDNSNTENLILY